MSTDTYPTIQAALDAGDLYAYLRMKRESGAAGSAAPAHPQSAAYDDFSGYSPAYVGGWPVDEDGEYL